VALLGEGEEIELLLQIRQKKKLTARGNVSTRITEGGGVVKGFSHHFLEEK
jgi:UDP-3-O-[3-hydroxymyristoyl] glucosamine N-acyltransferase